jgi:hypothetical protein
VTMINPRLRWVGVFTGPLTCFFGGESADAKANQQAQTAFYNTMTQQQATAFAENQDLYKTVKSVTEPIVQAGPNQYGFTPAEDQLLRGQISSSASQAEANSINAEQLRERQQAGGASLLPTGATAQLATDVNVLGEQQKATNLTNERLAGYQAGNQNYLQALNALTGEQNIVNPTSYASAATGAGNAATGAVNTLDSERTTFQGVVGGLLGGVGSVLSGAGNLAKGLNS